MSKLPYTTFNFRVTVTSGDPELDKANGAFSECSGLEATTSVKTIREGGNNVQPIHLPGTVSYANLNLKRGMTDSLALWKWFDRVLVDEQRHLRAEMTVDVLTADRKPAMRYRLLGCLPIKIKAPPLAGKDGAIAIEELEIAYEMLTREEVGARPQEAADA